MCTVTFIPKRGGYRLGMNRDEKLTRVAGLPPVRRKMEGRTVVSPSEPGGGTWIGLNDGGVCLALINWYAITARVKSNPVSRGEVVNAVSTAGTVEDAEKRLRKLPLKRINAFRLIGVFPGADEIYEWRWDLNTLVRKKHRWKAQQWISSGFDEPAAQRIRSGTFRRAQRQKTAGSRDWLRRLHRSHLPETGPFSICMHRADAATVSYTEVEFSPREAVMRYHVGALCQDSKEFVCVSLKHGEDQPFSRPFGT